MLDAAKAALDKVINPSSGKGLAESGMIHDLRVEEDAPAFTFHLRKQDPATLVRQARQAFRDAGLPNPRISVVDPDGPAPTTHRPPQSAQAGVPAPTPMAVPGIDKVVAISSGKGGVGKSTVSVNVAIALANRGHRVGLIDSDFYGPDVRSEEHTSELQSRENL